MKRHLARIFIRYPQKTAWCLGATGEEMRELGADSPLGCLETFTSAHVAGLV